LKTMLLSEIHRNLINYVPSEGCSDLVMNVSIKQDVHEESSKNTKKGDVTIFPWIIQTQLT